MQEILHTRIMVKKAMGRPEVASDAVLKRVYHARQLALKLIANVTYGYTAASFSGRMPCAELADAIVSTGRSTLQRAVALVEGRPAWGARVVYGDTDSMFVSLPGRSVADAFRIGAEIAAQVNARNPRPITLKVRHALDLPISSHAKLLSILVCSFVCV
jgi:DNA polymerase zeta